MRASDPIRHTVAKGGPRYILNPRPAPKLLSIAIPAYNEEEVLPMLRRELSTFLPTLPCAVEVILVNDGSSDRTAERLVMWAQEDERIKVVNLARNFGHQIAATAGLDYASGDAVVLMDADLQDPPMVIHEMLEKYCEGYDVVYAKRVLREGENAVKRITAWLFYRLMRSLIHKSLPEDVGDFRLMSSRALHGLQRMRETHRFLRGMVAWVGFPQTAVTYVRSPRAAGETHYPLHRMLRLAWTAATSFSALPLRLSLWMAIFIGFLGIVAGVYALWAISSGRPVVRGWTSLMVVICMIGSSILFAIGLLGEYVGRIFEEIKGRPLYLVANAVNVPADGVQTREMHANRSRS